MPARAALLALLLLAAAPAAAQVLYKWTDAHGKTQYSDRPPKGFSGEVTRIETELDKTTLPAPPGAPAAPAADAQPAEGAPPAPDFLAKRRAERKRLEAQLRLARANLDHARLALAEAGGPQPEERQVIQQRVTGQGAVGAATSIPNPDATQGSITGGGMHGMAPRSNCRVAADKDGSKAVICPTVLPGAGYFERIAALEEAVRKAEAALARAEQAYRRGAD